MENKIINSTISGILESVFYLKLKLLPEKNFTCKQTLKSRFNEPRPISPARGGHFDEFPIEGNNWI
jgi:hypothetical protein